MPCTAQILSLLPKETPIVNSEEWPESAILSLVANTLLNEGGPVQRTSNDPQMNSKVLSIHTEWEVDSNLKLIETLIDTGCNITAISQALMKAYQQGQVKGSVYFPNRQISKPAP